MSTRNNTLALAFIQSHPTAAAQLLENQDIDAVTGFLTSIPQRYAALIVCRMLPLYAARIISHIGAERAAGLVSRLDASTLAAILRYAKGRSRHKILQELPVKIRGACKLLLNYSEDAVGAWMDPAVATVPTETSVSDALARIKEQVAGGQAEPFLAVTRDREIAGVLNLPAMLDAHPESHLSLVLLPPLPQIPARMSLQTASLHAGWVENDVVSVVNTNKQLVGVLHHAALRKGLRHLSAESDQRRSEDPLTSLLDAYGGSLLALVGALVPPSRLSGTTGLST